MKRLQKLVLMTMIAFFGANSANAFSKRDQLKLDQINQEISYTKKRLQRLYKLNEDIKAKRLEAIKAGEKNKVKIYTAKAHDALYQKYMLKEHLQDAIDLRDELDVDDGLTGIKLIALQ